MQILLGLSCLIPFACKPAAFGQDRNADDSSQEAATAKKNLWTRDGQDWPDFLGAGRQSTSPETGFDFNWSDQLPKIAWQARVGEGYGIGSVAGGRYFHFDRFRDQARVLAIHAESGEELWQFTFPTDYKDYYGFDGGPRGSTIVDDDRVYAMGVQGRLVCLNAQTGSLIWEVDTAEKFGVVQNFFGVGSTPIVHGDLLIAMIGGSPPESRNLPQRQFAEVKPSGSGIVAFDKLTGQVRYQGVDDLASYSSPIVSKIDGHEMGIVFCRGGLYGFELSDGGTLFEFPYRAKKFESVNAATPVVIDGQILITESYGPGGALVALDGDSRGQSMSFVTKPVWKTESLRDAALACHWNTPVHVDGYVYASSGEKKSTATLNCVRLADGKRMWAQPRLTRSSLTLVDGHLLCLTEDGRLLVFKPNPEKFDLVAEYSQDKLGLVGPCWAAPVVSHGLLYVRGKSKVVCLDLKSR